MTQRTTEFALLRTLGATRRQVRRSVLVEALAVGALASVVGLAVGAVGLTRLIDVLGVPLPVTPPQLRLETGALSVLVGIAVTCLASLLPAYRASMVPPLAAVREAATGGPSPRRARRVAGWAVALGGGASAVAGAVSGRGTVFVGLGAAAAFLGLATLSPVIAGPLIRALGAPLLAAGVPGRVGRGNALRNPGRTAAAPPR